MEISGQYFENCVSSFFPLSLESEKCHEQGVVVLTDVYLSNCKTVIPPLLHSAGRLSCPFPGQSAPMEALLIILPK